MSQRGANVIYADKAVAARPHALDQLYADHRDRLLRFVMPRMHNDPDAAEDIVQEVFAAALLSLSGFKARSSPYTWLCSIAQHKIADHYRRELVKDSQSTGEVDDDLSERLRDGDQRSVVEAWLETQETTDEVRRALEQLPEDYERVLRRKYFAGLSTIELSVELGRTPKAVEGLLARARHALSERLTTTTDA